MEEGITSSAGVRVGFFVFALLLFLARYDFSNQVLDYDSSCKDSDKDEPVSNRSKKTENGSSSETRRFSLSKTFRRWTDHVQDHTFWLLRDRSEAATGGPYHHQAGLKDVVVHLFEWRWEDVAEECQRFLGPKGFAGVQVSPPNENAILMRPSWNREVERPWYERYRPVSYILDTRGGGEEDFARMTAKCNAAGISVYVDVVINHMSFHLDKEMSTAGSSFDSRRQSYPSVPYNHHHFNSRQKCGSRSGDIEDFQDVHQMRNCRLVGLNDLNQRHPEVSEAILFYLNHLIRLGVAGFRVDAAKHMWPRDLQVIFSKLDNLNDTYFPPATRPFIYQEVTDLGEDPISATEYTKLGRVTEFKFGLQLATIFKPAPRSGKLSDLKSLTTQPGFLKPHNAFVFVDNHDTQRGHGAGAVHPVLTFRDPESYTLAVTFMLAWPYGVPCVMSSYWWERNVKDGRDLNDWVGPPHDELWRIKKVEVTEEGGCSGGWVCEHRWPAISAMVAFRNAADGSPVTHWWDNCGDQIAFARQGKGFVAINTSSDEMKVLLQTGLPLGEYCDVLSSDCTRKMTVNAEGEGVVHVPVGLAVAYHVAV